MNPKIAEFVRNHVKELLEVGAIEESESPYAAPVVVVDKKNGEHRLCIDYRKLNSQTVRDAFPLPHLNTLVFKMRQAKLFSVMDLKSGYYQIPLNPKDRYKSAFVTPDGLYQFRVMPFGLMNAPATFQRMVNKFVESLNVKNVSAYLDDIVIFSETKEQHLADLEEVFTAMKDAGLYLNIKKSTFMLTKVSYLGFEISHNSVAVSEQRKLAVKNLQRPQDVPGIRRFLGMLNYFRQFIPNYAQRSKVLYDLVKKAVRWRWDTTEEESYNDLRNALME